MGRGSLSQCSADEGHGRDRGSLVSVTRAVPEDSQPREVQEVVGIVKRSWPGVRWTRLQVKHETDDDGLWFFWLPEHPGEVQIESSLGVCPFLIETDKHDERSEGATPEEVAETVVTWLGMPGGRNGSGWYRREG